MSDCSEAAVQQQKLADAFAKGGPGALAGLIAKPGEKWPCMMSPTLDGGFGMQYQSAALRQPVAPDGPGEDMGLKLDSERGPVEILVIDSAEMPDAN